MEYKTYKLDGAEFITIRNRNFFEVTLCCVGASIYEINHHFKTLTLTPSNVKDFLKPTSYYGKTLGRVAGRIAKGKIVINGKHYFLAQNENENVLHGGYFGLSTQTFTPTINILEDKAIVEFKYTSLDLESGFPGTLDVLVRYIILEKEDVLRIEYIAKSDKDTVLNLTNHVYFTLNETTNHNLLLKMNADKFIYPDDKNLLPLEYKDVDEVFDFRDGLYFKDHIFDNALTNVKASGYDHMFISSNEDDHLLTLEGSKYILDIHSSYKALQMYSDNIIDNVPMKDTLNISHRGVALEPQLDQLGDINLKAYENYNHYIEYRFGNK